MEFLNPIKGIGNKEIGDLMLFIVKDLRSPVGVFPFAGISIFIEGLSVKVSQAMGIPWEMGRYPV